jgi:hypothetical protein
MMKSMGLSPSEGEGGSVVNSHLLSCRSSTLDKEYWMCRVQESERFDETDSRSERSFQSLVCGVS